jgi:hypothetical protein
MRRALKNSRDRPTDKSSWRLEVIYVPIISDVQCFGNIMIVSCGHHVANTHVVIILVPCTSGRRVSIQHHTDP